MTSRVDAVRIDPVMEPGNVYPSLQGYHEAITSSTYIDEVIACLLLGLKQLPKKRQNLEIYQLILI
jgi:hypothetical protein